MSKFYVGQRVRVVKSAHAQVVGQTGVVEGPLDEWFSLLTGETFIGWPVALDSGYMGIHGKGFAFRADCIVPIDDDNTGLADWRDVEQMLPWKKSVTTFSHG